MKNFKWVLRLTFLTPHDRNLTKDSITIPWRYLDLLRITLWIFSNETRHIILPGLIVVLREEKWKSKGAT